MCFRQLALKGEVPGVVKSSLVNGFRLGPEDKKVFATPQRWFPQGRTGREIEGENA